MSTDKPMKVLLWELGDGKFFHELVLWDGENTYWTEEMTPSSGYKKSLQEMTKRKQDSKFTLVGEL